MTPEDIQTKVIAILTYHMHETALAAHPITPASTLDGDLGFDSLDDVEIIMAFEEEFNIDIPDEEAEDLKTVQDILTYVGRKIAA